LSQKSSQTLASLSLIDRVSSVLTLRPLISFDKNDIISRARDIGTFSISESVKEQCNLSDGPVTAIPSEDDLDLIPDLDPIVDDMLASITTYSGVLDLDTVTLSLGDIDIDTAFVVDIRSLSMRLKHPIDADISMAYPDILDHLDMFSKDSGYIIVCSQGVLSHELAHLLKGRHVKAVGVSTKEFLKLGC
ncbi:MAG: hypothetical protein ACOCZV_00165, partial [Nanoarchaeota archaeon]